MVNKNIILRLIDKLRKYLNDYSFLHQKYSLTDYENKPETYLAIDRILQLTIKCSIDIGKEIIVAADFEKPANYREVFIILHKRKVISRDLSKKMQVLARFRNELVHDYLFLAPQKVFNAFQDEFKTFKRYLKETEKILEAKNKKS